MHAFRYLVHCSAVQFTLLWYVAPCLGRSIYKLDAAVPLFLFKVWNCRSAESLAVIIIDMMVS